MMRKLLPLLALLGLCWAPQAQAVTYACTGAAGAMSANDANWALADTAAGETLTDLRLDGSGFCVQNNGFGSTRAFYTGTSVAAKAEILVPIGAFATVQSSYSLGVFIAGGAGNKGIEALVGASQMTGQVINTVRIASNGVFVASVDLTVGGTTIDTASVALTMSLLRTSTTNCNLVVNGTTYAVNTTGVDITSGTSGLFIVRNSGTATTLKIDSFTDGLAAGSSNVPRAMHYKRLMGH